MPGWDPTLSLDDTIATYQAEARLRYGDQRAGELDAPLRALAHDVWLVAQQTLEPTDAMPDTLLNPEEL